MQKEGMVKYKFSAQEPLSQKSADLHESFLT
jgi:hypothetical protein